MKKFALPLLSLSVVCMVSLVFSSCKEDEPPAMPRLSIEAPELTVAESVGTIEVKVLLDRAYSQDVTVEYSLSGTAVDIETAGSAALADYEVVGGTGEVDIDKGETEGIIEIEIYGDTGFEEDETIIVQIDDVDTEDIEITNDDEMEITITNDDSKVVASVTTASITVSESDGVDSEGELVKVDIGITLDQPAPTNLIVKYELSGTAYDSLSLYNEDPDIVGFSDYYIHGTLGEIPIAAGQTTGKAQVQLYTDFRYDPEETAIFTLVASQGIDVSTNKTTTLNIKQQDGKAIQLDWQAHAGVDMDIFLWIGEDVNNLEFVRAVSASPGTDPRVEIMFVPDLVTSGAFGLSYIYYSGSANPLGFRVQFIDVVDEVGEAAATREIFEASYTTDNINPWDDPNNGSAPLIAQTFTIVDGAFTDISAITVQSSGSRVKPMEIPSNVKKVKRGVYIHPKTFLK
jgi:hypothetical protein